MKKNKSLVSRTNVTDTPLTKKSGSIDAKKNIALPQAPINQTPPDFGKRRRRMGRALQLIIKNRGK